MARDQSALTVNHPPPREPLRLREDVTHCPSSPDVACQSGELAIRQQVAGERRPQHPLNRFRQGWLNALAHISNVAEPDNPPR